MSKQKDIYAATYYLKMAEKTNRLIELLLDESDDSNISNEVLDILKNDNEGKQIDWNDNGQL